MLTPGSAGPLSSKKLSAKLRSPTTPSAQPASDTHNGYIGDGERLPETPMDPLSQVCTDKVRDAETDANCALSYSKSYRERIRRPPYRNYDPRTPSRSNRQRHRTKRTQTRNSVERRPATQAGARQTRSKCTYSFTRAHGVSYGYMPRVSAYFVLRFRTRVSRLSSRFALLLA